MENFLDICLENKIISSICQLTRVTHSIATLTDSICINSQPHYHAYILTDDQSDHFLCLVGCELSFKKNLADTRLNFLQWHFSQNIYLKLNQ